MDREQRLSFLRSVHVGDYLRLQIEPASSRRVARDVSGFLVGLNYDHLYLSDSRPSHCVPEHQTDIKLRHIIEYWLDKPKWFTSSKTIRK